MNVLRTLSLCAVLAMVAFVLVTGPAMAESADHHAAAPMSDMQDMADATVENIDGPSHCPSDHPMDFKIMTYCMAMVPEAVAALYRHVAITVRPVQGVAAPPRAIRPPLRPPQPSA